MSTAQGKMFWLSSTNTVHRSDCHDCHMDDNAQVKHGWVQRHNWRGPYATKGAAIDAAIGAGGDVRECQSGCPPQQVNPAS